MILRINNLLHFEFYRSNVSNYCYSKNDNLLPLERQVAEMQMYENYVPLDKRSPTPHEIFLKVSQEYHMVYGSGLYLLFILYSIF